MSLGKVIHRLVWLGQRAPLVLASLLIIKLPWLRGYRHSLLSTWLMSDRRSSLDNLLWVTFFMLWSYLEYYPEKDPEAREGKKALAMGSKPGVAWAQGYDSTPLEEYFEIRPGKLSMWESIPVFAALQATLTIIPEDQECVVVQVGSSSGRGIAWVAKNFPRVRCVGTDVYPEVVEYAAASHRLPNLEFKLLSAKDIGEVFKWFGDRKYLIFGEGSLQYVQPEHISTFFRALASRSNVEVLLTEPYSSKLDLERVTTSVPRGGFSYSHNYKRYAEKQGFVTVEYRLISPEEFYAPDSPQGRAGHYYWRGVPAAARLPST